MILETLALIALTRVDPAGDAHGDGTLMPPTAPVYATMAPFDLVEVSVLDRAELAFRVRLAGMPNPAGLRHGVTLPVIDLYLDSDDEGGRSELLPGPGMVMPDGRGWDVAVRITGDTAYARTADDPDGPPLPVQVSRDEDGLIIATTLPRPEALHELHALTGAYHPFSATGWRPIASDPSPWAFSSDAPHPPVVDLTADDDETQRVAIATGVLPERARPAITGPWIWLMLGGVTVAVLGLVARRFGPSEAPVASPASAASAPEPAPEPATEPATEPASVPAPAAAGEPEPQAHAESHDAPDASPDAVPGAVPGAVPDAVPDAAADEPETPKPIDADDLAVALAEVRERDAVTVRPDRNATTTEDGRSVVLGRAGRTRIRAGTGPPASGLAASAAFRGSTSTDATGADAAERAEVRRLRTHWAENDGWWLEDPDEVDVAEGWTRLEASGAADPVDASDEDAPPERAPRDGGTSDDAAEDEAPEDDAPDDDPPARDRSSS